MHVGTDFLKLPPVTGQYWSLFQCSVLGTGGTCDGTRSTADFRVCPPRNVSRRLLLALGWTTLGSAVPKALKTKK